MIYYQSSGKNRYSELLYSIAIYTLIKSYYAGKDIPLTTISNLFEEITNKAKRNPNEFLEEVTSYLRSAGASSGQNSIYNSILEKLEETYKTFVIDNSIYKFEEILQSTGIFRDIIYLELHKRGLYGQKLIKLTDKYALEKTHDIRMDELQNSIKSGAKNLVEHLSMIASWWCKGATLKGTENLQVSYTSTKNGDYYDMNSISAEEFDAIKEDETSQYKSRSYYSAAMKLITRADDILFKQKAQRSAIDHRHSSIMNYLGNMEWENFSQTLRNSFSQDYKKDNLAIIERLWDERYTAPETKAVSAGGHSGFKQDLANEGNLIIKLLLRLIDSISRVCDLKTEYVIFVAIAYRNFCQIKQGVHPGIQEHFPNDIKYSASSNMLDPGEFKAVFDGIIAAQCVREVLTKNGHSLLAFPCIALRLGNWNKKSNLKELIEYTDVNQEMLSYTSKDNSDIVEVEIAKNSIDVIGLCSKQEEKFNSSEMLSEEFINTKIGGFTKLQLLTGTHNKTKLSQTSLENLKLLNKVIHSAIINLEAIDVSPVAERNMSDEERDYSTYMFLGFMDNLISNEQKYAQFEFSRNIFLILTKYLLEICQIRSKSFNITSIEYIKAFNIDKAKKAFSSALYEPIENLVNSLAVISEKDNALENSILYTINRMKTLIDDPEAFLNCAMEIYKSLFDIWSSMFKDYPDLVVYRNMYSISENALRIFVNLRLFLCLNSYKNNYINYLNYIDEMANKADNKSIINILFGDGTRPSIISRPCIRNINGNSLKDFYSKYFCDTVAHPGKSPKTNATYCFASIIQEQQNNIWDLVEQYYTHLQNQIKMLIDYLVDFYFKDITTILSESDLSNEYTDLYLAAAKAFEMSYISLSTIIDPRTVERLQDARLLNNVRGNVLTYSDGRLYIRNQLSKRCLYSIYGLQYDIDTEVVSTIREEEVPQILKNLIEG